MRAALLTRPNTIELVNVPEPVAGPGEVVVRIAAVGVCASDAHYYLHGRIGNAVVQYPTAMGHEPSGIVESAGPGVTLKPGTRVMIEPAAPCRQCWQCLEGRGHLCLNIKFLGTPPIAGAMSELLAWPAARCVPIPDDVSLPAAAMMEPMAVGVHAVRLARLELGQTVAVFGAGAVGLACALSAKAGGAGRIFVVEPVKERRDAAAALAGAETFDPAAGDPVQRIRAATANRGVDAAFEAAGEEAPFRACCELARGEGKVLAVGIPSEDDWAMPMHTCRRKELAVLHVRRSNDEAESCLALLRNGALPADKLATHFYTLDQTLESFQISIDRRDGVIRAVVCPNGIDFAKNR